MKTIRFTIFSILLGLLVLVSACKKESTPEAVTQSGSKILVTGQDAGIGLKSTLSGLSVNWVAGDKIGLYCAQANSNPTNAEYTTAVAGATSSFTGAMTWGSVVTHYFYAYYPWVTGSAASTVVPISLSATQTQSGYTSTHIGALDFTVATATASPGTSNDPVNVNLNYNHVFTLLEFDLQLASGSSTNLSSIELYSSDANLSLSSGTIDLTQASPTGDNPYTIVSPSGTKKVVLNVSGCTLSSASAIKAYMMILPGSQLTASGMTIKVISNTGETIIVKTGINFVRGKRYTIDLTALTFIPLKDADLNTYNTVRIGNQTWMASNLKTTKYNDGTTAIPNVTDNAAWAALSTGAYCYYNNNVGTDYGATYGALYNWYAVNTGKLCPVGWHVPTDAEWTTLTTFLTDNGYGYILLATDVGKSMAATSGWTSSVTAGNVGNDQASNNASGFNAVPGGCRISSGSFSNMGSTGYWRSSTTDSSGYPFQRSMDYARSDVYGTIGNKAPGYSVRCLRD
jgi:uncharacterized protein (TIGR02145 family)